MLASAAARGAHDALSRARRPADRSCDSGRGAACGIHLWALAGPLGSMGPGGRVATRRVSRSRPRDGPRLRPARGDPRRAAEQGRAVLMSWLYLATWIFVSYTRELAVATVASLAVLWLWRRRS